MYEYVGTAGWKPSTVYDLATWKNGLAFKNIDFSDEGRPIVKISELKNGVSSQTARTRASYDPSVLINSGDLLFSWSGNPDTSIDVFRWEGEEAWLNQHIFKVTPAAGISEEFLFFILRWLKPRLAEIARNKQTTGLGHVTIQDLKRMMVGIPTPIEQEAIVRILGPLQKKIDLNRQTNETLEAIAQAIFKDWLMDFGPTRAKIEGRKPYLSAGVWALFPDKFDTLGRPQGWDTEAVYDQATWVNGAAYKDMHFSSEPDALPVIKIAELKNGITRTTRFTNTDLGERYRIRDGELLFSWSGNPDTSIDTFVWTSATAWLNQHIFAVRPNGKRSQAFLYAMLKFLRSEFAEIARNKQTTGLGHVTQQDLIRLKITAPSHKVAAAFDDVVEPIHARFTNNLFENQALIATRDFLLPRLMSGEVRVRDAEKLVGNAT
jgi:type I restriction enzyme S subunit